MKSPQFSMAGWKFTAWLKGNIKTIKEVVKVGAPLLLGLAIFKDNPALVALVTALGKLALDSLEFYISNVELDN